MTISQPAPPPWCDKKNTKEFVGVRAGLTVVHREGVEQGVGLAGGPEPDGAIAGAGQQLLLGGVDGQPPHGVAVPLQALPQHARVWRGTR